MSNCFALNNASYNMYVCTYVYGIYNIRRCACLHVMHIWMPVMFRFPVPYVHGVTLI